MSNLKHVDALITVGKQQFQQIFAGRDVAFSDPVWEVGFLQVRLTGSELYKVRFTRWRTETKPLPALYADIVKSWLLLNPSSPHHWSEEADALRIFYEVLKQRHKHFKWTALSEEDVRQMELWLRKRYARATTYSRTNAVLKLARFLDSRAICRPLYYQVQTPCPSKAIFTEEAHARRQQRLPSRRALEGLADVYDHLAKFPPDRLRAAAVAVLAVTGFRISELLTVPVDCEIEEQHAGRQAYGIRYFKEKAKTPGKGFDVRWLTPLQAELARQAIAEIRQLTDAARVRAKELEMYDPEVPIPDIQPDDKLYARDVMYLLGLNRVDAVHTTLTNQNVPRYGYEKKYYFLGKDIAAYLRNKRVKYLWTVNMGNGRYQMLSESLFVVFCDFFFPNRRTLPLLVEPVRGGQINGFLTSHGEGRSIFERFDIREPDCSLCRMTTHQFRHWLNDLADKGGMPTDVLTRWMGRDNPRHTNAYKHATMDERMAWVKQGIQDGELTGAMSEAYFELPVVERDLFLDGQVQAVHYTPMGLCLHDFAIEPCAYHLNCVRGCPDYLRQKGNAQERGYLLQLKAQTEQTLQLTRQQEQAQSLAPAWMLHHEKTLLGIQRALAIDDDVDITDGELTTPEVATEKEKRNGT